MKKRPTIALACILKNEAKNIGPFLSSFKDCFDEIHLTDTGSTDNSLEMIAAAQEKDVAGCPIHVHHFEWVNNFAKARQYSFDQVPKHIDYVMWADLDDVLGNREEFIKFRDTVLHCSPLWLATYNYAFDSRGISQCSFLRERIVRNNYGFHWEYFVHEGLIAPDNRKVVAQVIDTWTIDHQRTDEDIKQDRSRNIRLFEANKETLDHRMRYYYGKELFEAGEFLKCIPILLEISKDTDPAFQLHDRVIAMQYLSMSYAQCGKWSDSLQIALQGIQLDPGRAEYWTLAGDANIRMNRVKDAIPFYEAARRGSNVSVKGLVYTSPVASQEYPTTQLANIYLNLGDFVSAEVEVKKLEEMGMEIAIGMRQRIDEFNALNSIPNGDDLVQTEDIIITCPPTGITSDWDENTLKNSPVGGSETACIEVAKHIRLKTGRTVKVFQNRSTADVMESGVEYLPTSPHLHGYLKKYKPKCHIAWRHSTRLTKAPSYIWSHDLITMGGHLLDNYDKYICLTNFHSDFVHVTQKVPKDKIIKLRNGIDETLFEEKRDKNPYKIIFSSSPDRGLERCIEIIKRAKEDIPELELHVFYGTANMRKMGHTQEADRLDKLVVDNSFVKYHGFVSKTELIGHMKNSAIWLYPADFIETSCITAMEAMCSGTYPLVRNMGALGDTLREAIERDMCTVLDTDASCDEEYQIWADELVKIIDNRSWEKMDISPMNYSWSVVADEFIEALDLK